MIPVSEPNVLAAFEAFNPSQRRCLSKIRKIIFEIANSTAEIGAVFESLKWGQPSYACKSGTPIRLGVTKSGACAVFTHCQTTVISDFRALFPNAFDYDGNRGAMMNPEKTLPEDSVRLLIKSAMTYRLP